MNKRNWIKTSVIVLFIILAGIFYSCRATKQEEPNITLQTEELIATQKDGQKTKLEDGSEYDTENSLENSSENGSEDGLKTISEDGLETITQDSIKYCYVHICGAVKEPDVYKVEENTRLIDVIKLAGGLKPDGAGDYVNQAAVVEDGQQIYIPTKNEVKDMVPSDYTVNESSNMELVKVNINTATTEELMTLTGIGTAKAKSIIAYRQDNDGFKTIEEIKNIDGIKESVYNKICDFIIVK